MKKFFVFLFLFTLGIVWNPVQAEAFDNSFVTIVNPIRGGDFWDLKDQKPIDAVLSQQKIIKQDNFPATWLIRFDALNDQEITKLLAINNSDQENGLLLEVTPSWTTQAAVQYRSSPVWHNAGSVFLTGYSLQERRMLIDTAFEKFKSVYGKYPQSVGAWWIDAYSLNYMQTKYKITSALIVADQYTTDNYQIWGQYWATPYYPSLDNVLHPAQNTSNKIPVVVMQWAARDPLNGYGEGVLESTFSVQANDYLDYHKLDTNYFSNLINVFMNQKQNQFNQVVVGLENSYSWNKYGYEYENQIKALANLKKEGKIQITNMSQFASWYQQIFPGISPDHLIVADDPLGSKYKVVWYMNPYYRIGWFYNQDGSVIRDVRQYVEGQKEPCLDSPCQAINFATFSTRVLDDVTYKQKLIIDQGSITNFKVSKVQDKYQITYTNAAGRVKTIGFLPRDIQIDNKTSSIDGFIMDAQVSQKKQSENKINPSSDNFEKYQESILSFVPKIVKFLLFLILGLFIPAFLIVRRLGEQNIVVNIFLSLTFSFVLLTLVAFISGYLKLPFLIYFYLISSFIIFIFKKEYKKLELSFKLSKQNIVTIGLIVLGTIFQTVSMIKSGWVYEFGIGFWGPLGHDGIWHQSLINQLIKGVPPENPSFSGTILTNYHYFYDLLVAVTFQITQIPVIDLLYRFYPVLFSLLLGIGTFTLTTKLFQKTFIAWAALYFVYFAGSFGWIVTYLKDKNIAGESAFWVNQPISMNLNPPFAISLLLIILVLILVHLYSQNRKITIGFMIILILATLLEFKVYAGIIVIGALLITSLFQLLIFKDWWLLVFTSLGTLLGGGLFLSQTSGSASLLVFMPFWFIHSMIEFSDRVGWAKLSSARLAYFERGEWLKFILVETLGFVLFVLGNLGTRAIGFLGITKFISSKLWKKPIFNTIFWMGIISLLIPTLFIQKGNPWNTIQFTYYLLYIFAIIAGVIIIRIFQSIPKTIKVAVILLILILTPLNAVVTFKEYLSKYSPSRLTLGEYEALSYLKIQPEGVVLTVPFNKNNKLKFNSPYPLLVYDTVSYVSAFSSKATFIEDEVQQEILQNDYKQRIVAANDFFTGKDYIWMDKFLAENKIRYVYIPKILNVDLDTEKLNLKKTFENDEAIIYQI